MRIESIHLWNFRCYSSLDVEFSPNFNVITGLNGQGKTSLLEAIYLLSSLKSFRGAKNSELILKSNEQSLIKGKVFGADIQTDLSVKIYPKVKSALINGKNCKFLSEYIGKMSSVAFSPSDLEIVRGAPELRRSWMDRTASIITPLHVDLCSRYNKVLSHRNKALKNFAMGLIKLGPDFEIWSDQLSALGAQIIHNRITSLQKSEKLANSAYGLISGKQEPVVFTYNSSLFEGLGTGQGDAPSVDSISQILKEKQEEFLPRESQIGTTLSGPHRDDLEITLNDQSLRAFGSQGEVRSAALSLRMTEIELIKQVSNTEPVLLVDDFSSELDAKRRNFLLEYLEKSGSQIFVTTTENLEFGNKIEIYEGRVKTYGDRCD